MRDHKQGGGGGWGRWWILTITIVLDRVVAIHGALSWTWTRG